MPLSLPLSTYLSLRLGGSRVRVGPLRKLTHCCLQTLSHKHIHTHTHIYIFMYLYHTWPMLFFLTLYYRHVIKGNEEFWLDLIVFIALAFRFYSSSFAAVHLPHLYTHTHTYITYNAYIYKYIYIYRERYINIKVLVIVLLQIPK